jgi:membrane protein implicated in regulation of membrane protease activity
MLWIWLALTVVFLVIEGVTAQLVTIWFAVGSLGAFITALAAPDNWILQIAVFAVLSAVALVCTRPLVRKITSSKKQPTNADMLIGREAIVTEDIDNVLGTGAVKASGREWTARSESDNTGYRKGTMVHVVRIEGVKLIVKE